MIYDISYKILKSLHCIIQDKKHHKSFTDSQMCLGILSKWEGEPPGSSSISRLTSEAKNLLANCELELEARDEDSMLLFH